MIHKTNHFRENNVKVYDIYHSEEKFQKFCNAFFLYKESFSKRFGNRKKYIPLKFNLHDKDFEITIDKCSPLAEIFYEVIDEIISKEHFNKIGRKYFYESTYTMEKEANLDLNNLNRFIFMNDKIYIYEDEDERVSKRNEIINCFSYHINEAKEYKEHFKSLEPDFTNYLDKKDSFFGNKESIKEYLRLIKQFKDDLKIDEYQKASIEMDNGDYSTNDNIVLGNDFESSLDILFKRVLENYEDIIGFVPCIENWRSERFLSTNVLKFKAILNDNRIKVIKSIRERVTEEICRYYAEKKPGEYCGD